MATASVVHLSDYNNGDVHRSEISPAQLKATSEFLQANHERNHIFFNGETQFHDHIVHHLLTLTALNASVGQIESAYKANAGYQRSRECYKDLSGKDLNDPETFKACLGMQEHYDDFLSYFQAKIQESNYQDVIRTYVFAGDARADDMLVRLFAGLLHPLIHFGFGIEFKQPAIVAEALAQTAVHSNSIGCLLVPAAKAANARPKSEAKTMVEIIDQVHNDQTLAKLWQFDVGGSRVIDIATRGGEHLSNIVGQYQVDVNNLDEQTAEMINAAVYCTAGVQRADKRIMMDFFSIHATNSSIFFPIFLQQEWLKPVDKARLLQYEIYHNLTSYAAIAAPAIKWNEVRDYKPKHPDMGWDGIQDRACAYVDDGHTSKLIRALMAGAQACRPFEHKDSFRVKGRDWLQIAHMVMDAVDHHEELVPSDNETEVVKGSRGRWIFGAGFDEPWNEIPARA